MTQPCLKHIDTTITFRNLRLRDFYAFNQMLTEKWTLGKCPNMSNLGKSVAGLFIYSMHLRRIRKHFSSHQHIPYRFCGYSLGNKEKKL